MQIHKASDDKNYTDVVVLWESFYPPKAVKGITHTVPVNDESIPQA